MPATAELSAAEKLLNRELSWLDYDARVLDQAANPSLPLLERAKNCAYCSGNLDAVQNMAQGGAAYFRIRIA